MDENTIFEVCGCSNAVLALRWNYTKCKGVDAFERLQKRIRAHATSAGASGKIRIEYGQPHRTRHELIIAV